MHLGGTSSATGECTTTCDFFCSTNWRQTRDYNGCEMWTYDHRSPTPDEDASCFPKRDAGPIVDATAD
jgi:hypothetical protein